jgi:hypothetical protein
MKNHVPDVDLTLRESGGVWKVDLCMVWCRPNAAKMIPAGEPYKTKDAAIAEMKGRVMEFLQNRDSANRVQKVNWRIVTIQ